MTFEQMCKQAIQHGKQAKPKPVDESHLPWEQCSNKERGRRISAVQGGLVKRSTRETIERLGKERATT